MVTSWQNTYRLTLFSLLFGLLVVGVGAYTRLADAGLGCPDWPGAEASFPDAPVEAEKAWWEMIHRYLASTLGLLIVAVCVSAWRHRRAGIPWKLPVALVVLVICQGAFGAWTVTLKLWPQVVTAHLLRIWWRLECRWQVPPARPGCVATGGVASGAWRLDLYQLRGVGVSRLSRLSGWCRVASNGLCQGVRLHPGGRTELSRRQVR